MKLDLGNREIAALERINSELCGLIEQLEADNAKAAKRRKPHPIFWVLWIAAGVSALRSRS